jgi:transcriptional antiterminator RfaH
MPLLPAEPKIFPSSLFADAAIHQSMDRVWWVLHTRPRQEKSLARVLFETGIPFFLPQIEQRRKVRRLVVTAHIPLFPGYLFLLGDGEERIGALASGRVVRSLEVVDQERLWNDLEQINRLICSGSPLRPEDRLTPGQTIMIRGGPLAGLRGTIVRTSSGRRFVVSVDFIQRGASVLLNDFELVPVDEC